MPSSFSPNLRIELVADGEQVGTWGDTTNQNFEEVLEAAIAGYTTVSVTAASQALTIANGVADEARSMMVAFTTTTGAAFAVYAPPVPKMYVVINSSAHTLTIYNSTVAGNTTAAGTGVAVAAGIRKVVVTNGTNCSEVGLTVAEATAIATAEAAAAEAAAVAAVDTATIVRTTGDQAVAGVKTFSSSPIIPTPTTDLQAATKAYADTKLPVVSGAARLPSWTTAGRPGSPGNGDFGLNTTLGCLEYYSTAFSAWVQEGWQIGTPVSVSGSNVDLPGVPAWANELALHFSGASTNGSVVWGVQALVGGVATTSGYSGAQVSIDATPDVDPLGSSFQISIASSGAAANGVFVLRRVSGNTWAAQSVLGLAAGGTVYALGGQVALAGELDGLRLTFGANSGDAGTLNLNWRK